MKKVVIILSTIALLASGCGQRTSKQADTTAIDPDSIRVIDETCLVFIFPKEKHFEDENSEEAENYFTAVDDMAWYTYETTARFEKLGIKVINIPFHEKERYLSFALDNGNNDAVDTKDIFFGALLYKKGEKPISIDIVINDWETISKYLQMKQSEVMKLIGEVENEKSSESEYAVKNFIFNTITCYDFEGTLGKMAIQLSICMYENDEFLQGSYCYKKYENKIRLAGGFNGYQLELTEFLNDKPNGYFKGKVFTNDADRFEGIWTDASGEKQLEFKLILKSSVGYNSPNQRYSDFSESDEGVENFMKKVKSSIANSDKEWIANNIRYPLKTTLNGQEKITIKNKQQLIDNFEQIFYSAYKEEIKKHCVCNMFYNSEGIMLGNGEIWINGNNIIAINN